MNKTNNDLTWEEFRNTLYNKFRFSNMKLFDSFYREYGLDNFFIFLDDLEPKLTVAEFNKIVLGVREKIFLSKENDVSKTISISEFAKEVKTIVEKSDLKLYERVLKINNKFCSYLKEHNLSKQGIGKIKRSLWKQSLMINEKVNETIYSTVKPVQIFDLFATLYSVIIKHAKPNDEKARLKVDKILVDNIAKKKKMVQALLDVNVSNQILAFDEFLTEISKPEYGEAAFKPEEIVKLLNKTPSLVNAASAEKWNQVYAALKKHIDRVAEKEGNDVDEANKIKNLVNRKSLLKQCGTIVVAKPSTIDFVSDLLMGNGVSEAVENNTESYLRTDKEKFLKRAFVKGAFGELKIAGINYETNKYILRSSLCFFKNLSSNAIYNSLDGLCFCLCKAYNIAPTNLTQNMLELKKRGINPAEFYTKDNIFDLFPYKILSEIFKANSDDPIKDSDNILSPEGKNLIANFELLSKFIPGSELMKIIQHNFGLLKAENEDLKTEIDNILNESVNKKDFCDKFDIFINSTYRKKSNRESSGSVRQSEERSNEVREEKGDREIILIDKYNDDEETLQKLFNVDDKGEDFTESSEISENEKSLDFFCVDCIKFIEDRMKAINGKEYQSNNNQDANGLAVNDLYLYKKWAKEIEEMTFLTDINDEGEKWAVYGYFSGLSDSLVEMKKRIEGEISEQVTFIKMYNDEKSEFSKNVQKVLNEANDKVESANSIISELYGNDSDLIKLEVKRFLNNLREKDKRFNDSFEDFASENDNNLTKMKNDAMQRYSDYIELKHGIEIMLNSIDNALDLIENNKNTEQVENNINKEERVKELTREIDRCKKIIDLNITKMNGQFKNHKGKIDFEDIKIDGSNSATCRKLTKNRQDSNFINTIAEKIMKAHKKIIKLTQEKEELGISNDNSSENPRTKK